MTVKPLYIGNLKAKVPVIQGGMGVGVSLGGLAGAVAKEGAVGIISSAQIGFREPDFDKDPMKANHRAMIKEYEKARSLAPEGIIGFNIMTASRFYEEDVRAAVKTGADLIVSGAGLPVDLPKFTDGTDVKLAPIVSGNKAAQIILKYWYRHYNRVPDLLVVEGPLAGGHLGFSRQQVIEHEKDNAFAFRSEIKKIIETVREYEKLSGRKIPVAAAGGIDTAEKAQEVFNLGVDAIQAATLFVTTRECDAADGFKEVYLNAKKEDIILVSSPVGMPGRAVRNSFTERVMGGERIPCRKCRKCLSACVPSEIPYCITDALINAADGDTVNGLFFCGANAYKAKEITTVKKVIDSLVNAG